MVKWKHLRLQCETLTKQGKRPCRAPGQLCKNGKVRCRVHGITAIDSCPVCDELDQEEEDKIEAEVEEEFKNGNQ